MIVFLDTNIVIYYVEGHPIWGPKALNRLAALRLAGDELAVSDLTRMEALVGPLRTGNTAALTAFAAFFSAAGLHVFSLTADVCNRAAPIRAVHRFRTPDALQLATAVENGCGLFLTNDAQLARFSGVRVEVLT